MRHTIAILIACAACAASGGCGTTQRTASPDLRYRRIALSPEPVEQPLLTGPPQTAGMRSGKVALAPGAAMHRHSTEHNEELLVFLQGRARVVLGAETVPAEAGQVLYIPPHTDHEVHNDGPGELTYIYTVAPAAR